MILIGNYTLLINCPIDSIKNCYYYYSYCDGNDNWNSTSINTISIEDNDPPEILGIDETIKADGYTVYLSTLIMDNIALDIVNIEYWYGFSIKGGYPLSSPKMGR